jgi:DNA-binding CsgD family transcriptional regulator
MAQLDPPNRRKSQRQITPALFCRKRRIRAAAPDPSEFLSRLVITMKLDYPYKTATVEEDATVVPRPVLPGCSSFTHTGTEGVLPNADIAATSEVAARYQNLGARLHEPSVLRRWDAGSERKREKSELSPLTKTRKSACPHDCRVCFLARKYGLTPREVTLIALISSGKSGRAISQTLGIGMPTIRKYCGIIHDKIGTHSRLTIGLWAIREGMVKSAVQPKSGFPCTGPLQGVPAMKSKLPPEEKLWP